MPSKEDVGGIPLLEHDEEAGDNDDATWKECAKDGLLSSHVAGPRAEADIFDERRCDDESVDADEFTDRESFDVEVIDEQFIDTPSSPGSVVEQEEWHEIQNTLSEETDEDGENVQRFCLDLMCPKKHQSSYHINYTQLPTEGPENGAPKRLERESSIIQNVIDDFKPNKGDQKILRAICRTATVNAAVLVTATMGGSTGMVGYATGGAITFKRLVDGLAQKDEKEVIKSLAVYACATGSSIAGQALTRAVLIGMAGTSLPVARTVSFGMGCCSGITAGALIEWTVDGIFEKIRRDKREQ